LFSVFRFCNDGEHSIHCMLLLSLSPWSGGEQEVTSRSMVRQSHRTNARDATMTVVPTATVVHRQPFAATAAVTRASCRPGWDIGAMHALLHNPLSPHNSPSAAEQWRHNIDRLVVITINTPRHGGRWANHSGRVSEPSVVHSCTPIAVRVPYASHAPTAPRVPAVSLATAVLQGELERRRLGEDDCVTS
jgi:hypothetical protein